MFNLQEIANGLETFKDISIGEERMMFGPFYKKYFNFKNAHISNRFTQLPSDIQLPMNSCIHVLNNLYNEERGLLTTDLPDLDNPFINNETYRKFIYHVKEPNINNPDLPIYLPDQKYIFRNMMLDQNLRKFRTTYGDKIRPLYDLKALPTQSSTLTIINHNPLFRVRVRELLPQYKRFLVILGTILNTASLVPDEKTQYILFPLGPHVYFKDMFKLAEKEIKPTTIKVKTDFHYFLMMHWLNFLNPNSDQSLILKYPESKWDKTVFVFYYNNYYMFYSLADIVKLNERNLAYNRIVNQFNSLVLTGLGAEVPDDDTTESEIEEIADTTKVTVEGTPDKQQDIQKEEEKQQIIEQNKKEESLLQKAANDILGISRTISKVIAIDETDSSLPNLKYTTVKNRQDETLPDDIEIPEVVTGLIDNVNIPETVTEVATIENPQIEEPTPEELEIDPTIKPTQYLSGDLSKITPYKNSTEIANLGKSFIENIDKKADKLIAEQINLTKKQKERLVRLSRAYKNISIGDKSLETILTTGEDINVSKNTIDTLDNYLPDKSMKDSSVQTFDTDYMKKLYNKHLSEVAISFNAQGMFLVGMDSKVISDELNRLITYKLSYEDIRGKRHTVKFTLPLVGDDGICYVNGTRQYFRTQMTNLPICKVSPVRVSLASNYNKTIVERNINKAHSFLPYLQRLISKINEETSNSIVLEYGVSKDTSVRLPYEYAEISNIYKSMTLIDKASSAKYLFTFVHTGRLSYPLFNLTDANIKYITNIEKQLDAVFLGIKSATNNPTLYCFITKNNIIKIIDNQENVISSTTFIDMLTSLYNVNLGSRLNEWTEIKILDKKFPVGFLLAYRYGLQYTLKYLGIQYKIFKKPARLSTQSLRPSDIVLNFKDSYIVIPRYPIRNSLIIAGLNLFNLNNYNLEQFESKDIYYQLLLDKGFKINYLKGIDDTFELFVDPMTREVLLQMNEPITFRDLLIRATDMVSNNYHKEAASMSNFRYRSYERFNGIVYNELSRQFASFTKKRGAGNTFSINPNAVLLKVIQDSAMLNVEDINPIHDIKTKTEFTYVGQGGRTNESFVINDRRFPTDGIGIISEATKDSGNVSICAQMPMNPTVSNLYGLFDYKDKKDLNSAEILSVSNLTMPCTTQDDGKRAGFVSHQLSHAMATKEGSVFRMRTGYESMIAHRSNSIYAYSAKQDGKVIEINEQAKMCKIQYKDGSIHTFTFGEEYGTCADLITTQKQQITVQTGDKFKQGEILCYNPQFFEKDPYQRQVYWKHGVPATVALIEIAGDYEDSSTISKSFGEKLAIEPVQVRMFTLDKNTFVHMYKKIGEHVDITDELMIFEDAGTTDLSGIAKNDEALAYLSRLNRATPKAKFAGEIVGIEMYLGCPISEIHETLRPIYNEANRVKRARHRFTEDSLDAIYNPEVKQIPKGTKYKGVDFDENTVVIRYLIKEELVASVGDKIVVDSSLKSVISDVLSEPVKTESGLPVDILFAISGLSNRIVCSPVIVGIGERILSELEKQVIEMYE